MTKDEAKQALKDGKRIRHSGFTQDEWVEQHGTQYLFEDGYTGYMEEFWRHRTDSWWDDGWEVK